MVFIQHPFVAYRVYAALRPRDYHHQVPLHTLHCRAHAKINLALAVGPRITHGHGAGYHPISGWFHAVGLFDLVTITRLPPDSPAEIDARWSGGAPVNWSNESDLAARAHRRLETLAGPLPARVEIIKHIPAGGGLGGGSSDAAAVLRGLVRLFDIDLEPGALRDLAHSLGSDIPYFLDDNDDPLAPPRPALVTHLGERIERLPPPPPPPAPGRQVLLICPPFGCSTADVYRAFDRAGENRPFRAEDVERLARAGRLEPAALFNDLAEPAEAVEPRLRHLRLTLESALGLPVHLSGSGSTLFCFPTAPDVDTVRETCPAASIHLVNLTGSD